jgi:hypothetical protein
MALAIAVATSCAIIAACSLTTSLEGLSGGRNGATDGGAEGSTSDGGGGDGPANDGPVVVNDAAPDGPYCTTLTPKPFFCDDFDETSGFASGWSLVQSNNMTASLDSNESASRPTSLRATALGDAGCKFSGLSRAAVAAPTALHWSFDARVEGPGGALPGTIVVGQQVDLENGTPGAPVCTVYLFVGPMRAQLGIDVSGGSTTLLDLSLPFAASTWTHVEVGVPTDTTKPMRVMFDGALVSGPETLLPAPCAPAILRRVFAGISCPGVITGTYDTHVDNIAIWTE